MCDIALSAIFLWINIKNTMRKMPLILLLILSSATLIYSQTTSSESNNRQVIKEPKSNFQSDGCIVWFDGEYKGCYEKHDRSYFKSSGWRTRLKADNQLFMCVANMGLEYSIVAPVIWVGVRVFGSPWFPIHKKRKVK